MIGKAGTIVKQVREETGARIRVVEAIPSCDERVIVISAPNLAGRPTHAAQVQAALSQLAIWAESACKSGGFS